MKGVVENLLKLVPVKLVLAKVGNGEKKFLQNNTIVTKNNNEFYFQNQPLNIENCYYSPQRRKGRKGIPSAAKPQPNPPLKKGG